jgi:hypothetical protein
MPTTPLPSRVIKHDKLPAATQAHAPAAPQGACAAPTVRLVRAGNVVKAIRVDCLCGRVLEIECVLEQNAAGAAAGAP